MRKALTNCSLTKEQEKHLVSYLQSDKNYPELALMHLVRYYSGLPINELRALTCNDFLYDAELNLGRLSVTKSMIYRSNEVKMLPEEYRRYIPLPSMVTYKLREYLDNRKYSSKTPLFENQRGKSKVITAKQIYTYFNSIL